MKIFISFARADLDFARNLSVAIERLGTHVDNPADDLGAGSEWANSMELGLRESDALLLIVPEAGSPVANNVYFEAGAARALGKQMLAVVPDQGQFHRRDVPTDMLDMVVLDAARQPIERVARTLVIAMGPT